MNNVTIENKVKAESKLDRKKYVRYDVACDMYGMKLTKLKEVARDAGAVYKLNRMVLISIDKMDEYIESFLYCQ